MFATDHPIAFGLIVWPLITAFVTGLFAAFGHMSADDYAKLPPWLAKVLQVIASSGFDAPKVLKILWSLFDGPAAAVMLVVLALTCVQACSFFQTPQGVQTAGFAAQELVCIFEHRTEPPLQIASDCIHDTAPAIVQEIETLVSSERVAAQHTAHDAGADR